MAPLQAAGGIVAACALVPLLFVVAIAMTGAIGSRLGGAAAGIVAAVWLATSPVAIYESMQPMSDIPVTAAWLVCWWLCIRGSVGRTAQPDDAHDAPRPLVRCWPVSPVPPRS